MKRSLTEKFELEEEIRRLNLRVKRLEAECERLRTSGAIMCKKTLDLAMALKIPFKDILRYYHD